MGILRKLMQWREKSDGTLEGPALSTESVDSNEYLQDGEPLATGDIEGLTNPLVEDLDADGNNLENVGSVDAEEGFTESVPDDPNAITNRSWVESNGDTGGVASTGYDYLVYHSGDDKLAALDQSGDLIAGGDDELNLDDGEDFAELLEYLINDLPGSYPRDDWAPAIKLAPIENAPTQYYQLKSTATLTRHFSLWGVGKNRVLIDAGVDMDGQDGIVHDFDGESSWITRIDSIKFGGVSGHSSPDTWFYAPRVNELNMTHTEFRSSGDVIVDWENADTGNWNIFLDCWWLAGSNLELRNGGDVRFIANRARTEVKFENISDLAIAGNSFEDEPEFIDCDIEPLRNIRGINQEYRVTSEPEFEDALEAVDNGESIRLFPSCRIMGNHTLSTQGVSIIGSGRGTGNGAYVFDDAALTISANNCTVERCGFRDTDVIISGRDSGVDNCRLNPGSSVELNEELGYVLNSTTEAASVTATDDYARVNNNYRPEVVFEDGTSGGIAIGNARADITDTGNNEIGPNS